MFRKKKSKSFRKFWKKRVCVCIYNFLNIKEESKYIQKMSKYSQQSNWNKKIPKYIYTILIQFKNFEKIRNRKFRNQN